MKSPFTLDRRLVALPFIVLTLAMLALTGSAQSYTNGLFAYWPFDVVTNGITPDVMSSFDLSLHNISAGDLTPGRAPGANKAMKFFSTSSTSGSSAYYVAHAGEKLPVMNRPAFTINMWVDVQGQSGKTNSYGQAASPDNAYIYADEYNSSLNPLWTITTHNTDAQAHWKLVQNSGGTTNTPYKFGASSLLGKDEQLPVHFLPGTLPSTGSNAFDGTWHMLTITRDTRGSYTVCVDGSPDPGNSLVNNHDLDGNPSVLAPEYTTNIDTNSIFFGQPWLWDVNVTVFGGVYSFYGLFFNGALDSVGMWDRALTTNEITQLYQDTRTSDLAVGPGCLCGPLTFSADFTNSAAGGPTTLHWSTPNISNLALSNNLAGALIDVSGLTSFIVTNLSTTTWSLIDGATGTPTVRGTITIFPFPGVNSQWNLLDIFDNYPDSSAGIVGGQWFSGTADFQGVFDRFNVVTITNNGVVNKVLTPRTGYMIDALPPPPTIPRGADAFLPLNSLAVPPGQSNTLFFRFSVVNKGTDSDSDNTDFSLVVSLTDVTPIGPSTFDFGSGSYVRFARELTSSEYPPVGGPVNLRARSGTNGYIANYNYTNSVPAGLVSNAIYNVWLDVRNNAETLNGAGNLTNADTFSIWIQKQGDLSRTLLVSNYYSDRNTFGGGVSPDLDKLLLNLRQGDASVPPGSYLGTNTIRLDDFFISRSGYASSVPRLLDIRTVSIVGNSVTLNWDSLPPMSEFSTVTYTVQKSTSLTSPVWNNVGIAVPSGGYSTTFTDNTATDDTAFYRVTCP